MTEPYDYEADLDNTDYSDPYEEDNYYYDQDTEYGISDDPDDYEPDLDEAYEIESSLGSVGWGTDEFYGYEGDPPF